MAHVRTWIRIYFVPAILLLLGWFPSKAQKDEIPFLLRIPQGGNRYITCLHDSLLQKTFMPVTELFSILELNYNTDWENLRVEGYFLSPDSSFCIDLKQRRIQLGKRNFSLSENDFRRGLSDYYLSLQTFEEIFSFRFLPDLPRLILDMETPYHLPVAKRLARSVTREKTMNQIPPSRNFPLVSGLNRKFLDGVFLDYTVTGCYLRDHSNAGITLTGGMEILGGDFQGNVTGHLLGKGNNRLYINNLRWRYAILENKLISGFTAGQIYTSGLKPLPIRGISITNERIEPRTTFDTFLFDGTTDPESEVELYVEERLMAFCQSDELGYYRFEVPVFYGTNKVRLKIYKRSGETVLINKQIQVPYTFLPKGEFTFNVEGGRMGFIDSFAGQNPWLANGKITYGIHRNLSCSLGGTTKTNAPKKPAFMLYGSFSARIAKQYLINADLAPGNLFRIHGSVIYPGNSSVSVGYNRYSGNGAFYPPELRQEFNSSVILPLSVLQKGSVLRINGRLLSSLTGRTTALRSDFNIRLTDLLLRFHYQTSRFNINGNSNRFTSLGVHASTHLMEPSLPGFLRGTVIRCQVLFDPGKSALRSSEINISRELFHNGKLNLIQHYNFLTKTYHLLINLTLDISKIRSITSVEINNDVSSTSQTLSGSIGMNLKRKIVSLSKLQQVGMAMAAVLLFTDNNNNGFYDGGDQMLPWNAVILDRSHIVEIGKEGIIRISQLQSYVLHNLKINRHAIPDGTLVPLLEELSFIPDPNQIKIIEIPFYRCGIAEGTVSMERNGKMTGISGVSLILRKNGTLTDKQISTFSDGSFYLMELAPGCYTLEVEPSQAELLKAGTPEPVKFDIKASAEGDYIDNVQIILRPAKK